MRSCTITYKLRWTVIGGMLAAWFVLSGCVVPFQNDRDRRPEKNDDQVERSDPLASRGDGAIVTERDIGLLDYSRVSHDTAATRTISTTLADTAAAGGRFDVQFYAALSVVSARQVKNQVDTLTVMPVRVIFEEPYYKVLAGPYSTFEEAERFLRAVTRMGFSSAWIIGRKVNAGE